MTDLSPAAQAIVNAAVEGGGGYGRATLVLHARLAAALQAAADQLTPYAVDEMWGAAMARNKLIDIATELKNSGLSEINSES